MIKRCGLHEGYLRYADFQIGSDDWASISPEQPTAVLAGIVLDIVGSVIAGIPNPLDPIRMVKVFCLSSY